MSPNSPVIFGSPSPHIWLVVVQFHHLEKWWSEFVNGFRMTSHRWKIIKWKIIHSCLKPTRSFFHFFHRSFQQNPIVFFNLPSNQRIVLHLQQHIIVQIRWEDWMAMSTYVVTKKHPQLVGKAISFLGLPKVMSFCFQNILQLASSSSLGMEEHQVGKPKTEFISTRWLFCK